jgi:hypothetical protein
MSSNIPRFSCRIAALRLRQRNKFFTRRNFLPKRRRTVDFHASFKNKTSNRIFHCCPLIGLDSFISNKYQERPIPFRLRNSNGFLSLFIFGMRYLLNEGSEVVTLVRRRHRCLPAGGCLLSSCERHESKHLKATFRAPSWT